MLENEKFSGAWVRLPIGMFERIAVAAENHHARLARYVDTTTLNGTCDAIASWLADLEAARTSPSPSAEPGDLLVKLKRAEFWSFTSRGWLELAPVYRMGDERAEQTEEPFDPRTIGEHGAASAPKAGGLFGRSADEGRRQTVEFTSETADRGWDEHEAARQVAADPTMAAGGEKVASPEECAAMRRRQPRRFFGRSIVEDELDRLRAGAEERIERAEREMEDAAAERPPCPACDAKAAADTLEQAATILDSIGGSDPWSTEEIVAAACGMRETLKTLGIK